MSCRNGEYAFTRKGSCFFPLPVAPVLLVAYVALACLLSACGGGVALNLSTISLNPTSINFGEVGVGSGSTKNVTLNNTGTSGLSVSQATVSGTGFSLSGLTLPLTLAAGQSTTFTVNFSPTTTGSVTGSVSITSNATGSPTTVSLAGTGITLVLAASPLSLNFGNVLVGNSGAQPVTLHNTGTGSVMVSQATATGTGFSLSGLTLPLTLAAGQSTTFTVNFSPTTTGSVTGNVSIVSNATNSSGAVSLSGSGVKAHSAQLSWIASTSTVAGYNVYRGTTSGGPYTKLNPSLVPGTTYTDNTVAAGQTYYYVGTAVTSSNVESAFSNQAQAVVPFP